MASFADLKNGAVPASPSSPSPSKGGASLPVSSLFTSSIKGTPVPGTDLVIVSSPPRNKTIGVLFGQDGCGKSYFVANHCPGPVLFINCDRRAEEVAFDAGTRGKTIYYLDAALPANIRQLSSDAAKEVATYALDRIVQNYEWGLAQAREGKLATIGIDTGTELTNIVHFAITGKGESSKPSKEEKGDFGAGARLIKQQMWYFTNAARESRVNLIILSRVKEIYDGPKPTGEYTWDCHPVLRQACDWCAEIRLSSIGSKIEQETKEAGGKLSALRLLQLEKEGPSFEFRIPNAPVGKSGLNLNELGKVYTEKDWGEAGPFAYACSRLIPRTKVEDWK